MGCRGGRLPEGRVLEMLSRNSLLWCHNHQQNRVSESVSDQDSKHDMRGEQGADVGPPGQFSAKRSTCSEVHRKTPAFWSSRCRWNQKEREYVEPERSHMRRRAVRTSGLVPMRRRRDESTGVNGREGSNRDGREGSNSEARAAFPTCDTRPRDLLSSRASKTRSHRYMNDILLRHTSNLRSKCQKLVKRIKKQRCNPTYTDLHPTRGSARQSVIYSQGCAQFIQYK
eukprot:586948-Prorocentrum_minimum.AAC.3